MDENLPVGRQVVNEENCIDEQENESTMAGSRPREF
jgi:hypothetical protein